MFDESKYDHDDAGKTIAGTWWEDDDDVDVEEEDDDQGEEQPQNRKIYYARTCADKTRMDMGEVVCAHR